MVTDIEKWNAWVKNLSTTASNTAVRTANIEKTLSSYHQLIKRMLWFNTLLLIGVAFINGLLLFYK